MKKTFHCGDVMKGCPTDIHGKDEKDVLKKVTDHAKTAHGLKTIDATTAAKVKAAIHDEPEPGKRL